MTRSDFLDRALRVARDAAAAGASEIAKYYRRSAAVEWKADATPVTIADRNAERAIRQVLGAAFPQHEIYGEEEGGERADAEFLWLVDPLDGTRAFVRDYPLFSTQIALRVRGELVLGVSHAPLFGESAWAARGGGAFLDGERVQVGAPASLAQAQLSFGNLKSLAADPPRWQRLAGLVGAAERTRGYGDFYHYHLLVRGAVDAVIESDVNILDIAALSVIVTEAGGVFTDLEGAAIDLGTRSVLAAAPTLHAQLREALG
ncbi:MAG: inositol monophosphatase family protein [Lysobacterales bacterium]